MKIPIGVIEVRSDGYRGFCPTGPGGGIDNSCGRGGGGASTIPVENGGGASDAGVALFSSVLEKIPPKYRDLANSTIGGGKTLNIEVDGREHPRMDLYGVYDSFAHSVYVSEKDSSGGLVTEEDAFRLLSHEMGHAADQLGVDPKWGDVQYRSRDNDFVNAVKADYAAASEADRVKFAYFFDNKKEAFAEHFSYHCGAAKFGITGKTVDRAGYESVFANSLPRMKQLLDAAEPVKKSIEWAH